MEIDLVTKGSGCIDITTLIGSDAMAFIIQYASKTMNPVEFT